MAAQPPEVNPATPGLDVPGPVSREPDPIGTARRAAAEMYADDLASRTAGISVDEVAPGQATASMTVNETMINGHGICHGGYVFLLADTAFAFACNTYGTPTVAQGCDIEFVRPVRLGDRLVATASERGRYGRNGIYDVTVTCGDDVVAEFRGRSRAIGPRSGRKAEQEAS